MITRRNTILLLGGTAVAACSGRGGAVPASRPKVRGVEQIGFNIGTYAGDHPTYAPGCIFKNWGKRCTFSASGNGGALMVPDLLPPSLEGRYEVTTDPEWRPFAYGSKIGTTGGNWTFTSAGRPGKWHCTISGPNDPARSGHRAIGCTGSPPKRFDVKLLDDPEPDKIACREFRAAVKSVPSGGVRVMDLVCTNAHAVGGPPLTEASRSKPDDLSWIDVGVPYEAVVQLLNELRADNPGVFGWVEWPERHDQDDGYTAAKAAYIRDHLHPAIRIKREYSNEIWNYGFSQRADITFAGLRRGIWGEAAARNQPLRFAVSLDGKTPAAMAAGEIVVANYAGFRTRQPVPAGTPIAENGLFASAFSQADAVTGYLREAAERDLELIAIWKRAFGADYARRVETVAMGQWVMDPAHEMDVRLAWKDYGKEIAAIGGAFYIGGRNSLDPTPARQLAAAASFDDQYARGFAAAIANQKRIATQWGDYAAARGLGTFWYEGGLDKSTTETKAIARDPRAAGVLRQLTETMLATGADFAFFNLEDCTNYGMMADMTDIHSPELDGVRAGLRAVSPAQG